MNAPLIVHAPLPQNTDRLTKDDLVELASKGRDVDIDEIKVLDDGTLAHKDSRVLVYIRDVAIYQNRDVDESLPKFHVANCSALINMKKNNRFGKYVVSIRNDGKFQLILIKHNISQAATKELDICKCCLDLLSYKGYSYSNRKLSLEVFKAFSIDEYFSIYPQSIFITKPKYTNADAPLNDYSPDFKEISLRYRAKKNWCCEKCSINLSYLSHRQYLHTHHINGLKYDNLEENFEALCIYCHAHEPMSAHIKNLPQYEEFLKIYPILHQYQNKDYLKRK